MPDWLQVIISLSALAWGIIAGYEVGLARAAGHGVTASTAVPFVVVPMLLYLAIGFAGGRSGVVKLLGLFGFAFLLGNIFSAIT